VKDEHVNFRGAGRGGGCDAGRGGGHGGGRLGRRGDGSVKVVIFSIVIFQRWNPRPEHACPHACHKVTRKGRRRCTTRAKPSLRSFNLEAGNLEPQDAQGWSRARPARPTRTVSSSSRQALFERSKPIVGAAGPGTVFDTSHARFGVGGTRSAAQRHGKVLLRTHRRG